MCGSCHFKRAANREFSIAFWMFVLILFSADIEIRSERSPIHSKLSLFWRYPNFKTQSWLKNITITNIQNSTLNLSFDALSKWHDCHLWEFGPNCFLTAEYLTAITVARCKFIFAMFIIPTLPLDKFPKLAPNLFLGSWK